jgi:SecD/SecF fusion protein
VTTDSTAIAEVNPLIDLIKGQGYQGGPVIAMFETKDKQVVSDYLARPDIRNLLSPDQRYVKFLWGKETPESELIELYAIKGNREGAPELSGAVITDARQSYSTTGKPSVSMQMNSKGAKVWEDMTGKAFSEGGQIAIVLDEIVYSAPGVTTGPISGGNSEISGQFTINEAVDLANVLRAGNYQPRPILFKLKKLVHHLV